MEYFDLEICGLKRRLPISYVSKKAQLANFSILGDVELVDALADELFSRLKNIDFDYLVATEVKVVPLVHGIAKRLGHKKFILCRKSVKPYMIRPVILKPMSHFPKHVKQVVVDGVDAELLEGRKVIVVDAVISTGVTMRMMNKLMEKIGAVVVMTVAVLKQGQQFDDIKNLLFLKEIPIIGVEN